MLCIATDAVRLDRMTPLLRAVTAIVLSLSAPAMAQVLSSPLGAAPATAPAASQGNTPAIPHGQGAGVHSPLSPFAPLPKRTDVVPWSVLTDIRTQVVNKRISPVFPPAVQALGQRVQRIQGFMMPLEPGEKQRHFLLSSVPLTCSFCLPGGPESMVEVRTREPVRYSLNAVVVEGRFHVLQSDPYGLYYRITEAVAVK